MTITIVRLNGDAVRIGIDAPNHVTILRGELVEADEQADTPDGVTQPGSVTEGRPA